MPENLFSPTDLEQIRSRGADPDIVRAQVATFEKGIAPSDLRRPCTPGDGITVLKEAERGRLTAGFESEVKTGRIRKFVPASGAATRMFQPLHVVFNRWQSGEDPCRPESGTEDADCRDVQRLMENLDRFAFYEPLQSALAGAGRDLKALLEQRHWGPVLQALLKSPGLGYGELPKGLIPFHRYADHSRTPFEEHLAEAAAYTRDGRSRCRLHFTVTAHHEAAIRAHLAEACRPAPADRIEYRLSYSHQHPATDTIAVDLDNRPFRDENGRLVFRPAGHGALLENLNALQADVVFIKNIDNVVPDRLRDTTVEYKKALGGLLFEIQQQVFACLRRLEGGDLSARDLDALVSETRRLPIRPLDGVRTGPPAQRTAILRRRLNRPLRVCGMVANVGQPGGGPFWVRDADGRDSLQIVESSQVDMTCEAQRRIWESSTHFNPVDLVCGLRDYRGNPFDLRAFADPEAGFIATKSSHGRTLKALELPGLWNGSMARWNTVFVQVPGITFNPVKTVLHLLQEEHRS